MTRRLLVINPNASVEVSRRIRAVAAAAAGPGSEFVVANPPRGLPGIEGYADGAAALSGLLDLVRRGAAAGYDGFVLACFDDIGLDAARCLTTAPVVGMCEAGLALCAMTARRYAIVTTLGRAIPIITDNVRRYGHGDRCVVRAAEVRVTDAASGADGAEAKIRAAVERALEDGAEAVLLGSASMSGLAGPLAKAAGAPVIDGVAAAVKLAEALAALGLGPSKRGAYAAPLPKAAVEAREFLEL